MKIEESIMPARFDWPSSIGHFILNFGTLESVIFIFMEKYFSKDEFERTRNFHMKDRLDRMLQLMEDQVEVFPKKDCEAMAEFIQTFKPIRELRNHIAHGCMATVIVEGEKSKFTISAPKEMDQPYESDARHVDCKELQAGIVQLDQLSANFQEIAQVWDSKTEMPLL